MATPRNTSADKAHAAVNKIVDDVMSVEDLTQRIALATAVINSLRAAVSTLSADRQQSAVEAKEQGVSFAELARAAGMSTGRMAAIASGRGQYKPVGHREPLPKSKPAAKSTPTKTAKANNGNNTRKPRQSRAQRGAAKAAADNK